MGRCRVNTMAFHKLPVGLAVWFSLDCLRELFWPRRLSHSVHASGCIGQVLSHACITLAQTLLVWLPCERAQRAHCVLVSLSSSSHERRQPHLQRAQRRSPMFNRLLVHALPAVIHLRLHWTGPPAPLSRGILFPHPPTPLLLARSRRPAELHHRDRTDYRASHRSDRAKPTIFVALFDRIYCLIC